MPCDLCTAAPLTHRYHADATCWVADCRLCRVPMVVWREHGTAPSAEVRGSMLDRLREAAEKHFAAAWTIDTHQRAIPDHWHAHARPA